MIGGTFFNDDYLCTLPRVIMVPYEASMDNEGMFLLFSLSFLMIFPNSIFLQYENLEQLCNDPRARAAVLAEMDAVGMEAQVILKINYFL